jgi:hypothetical protein
MTKNDLRSYNSIYYLIYSIFLGDAPPDLSLIWDGSNNNSIGAVRVCLPPCMYINFSLFTTGRCMPSLVTSPLELASAPRQIELVHCRVNPSLLCGGLQASSLVSTPSLFRFNSLSDPSFSY